MAPSPDTAQQNSGSLSAHDSPQAVDDVFQQATNSDDIGLSENR